MSENTYKPRDYRIVRHVTKNRILDIRDTLEIGKLRIELVDFVEGQGAKLAIEHYAEPDALALVCQDIVERRPFEKYVEFKGTVQGETAVSRVLVIERVEARNPIKISVSRGPGKVMAQGAIQPLGKPEASLAVLLSEFDARRIALTVLRHMAAYEAATYHARVAAGTRRPTPEVELEGEVDAAPEPEGAAPEQAAAAELQPAPAQPQSAPTPLAAAAPAEPARPQPAPAPRRVAPRVETYWMAAERLGYTRREAEQILADVQRDWGRAWAVIRSGEQRQGVTESR